LTSAILKRLGIVFSNHSLQIPPLSASRNFSATGEPNNRTQLLPSVGSLSVESPAEDYILLNQDVRLLGHMQSLVSKLQCAATRKLSETGFRLSLMHSKIRMSKRSIVVPIPGIFFTNRVATDDWRVYHNA